eukprot:gnl/TRDRNA2_/TRDRNA2_167797_c1_seq1.p3 gnl/TRDRNA2_/TRDRNA2_167797_c1~~gnl/TRDRNA2_/TRDRNA2_167797_c1_seq1.p3  ORF type:complete len:198 (+),score=25.12 gnl/TRDRNA2_/TRDRNA2_167797_c1_seq1:22-594(+)
MVRDPVDRFLSHFYHARRLDWTAGLLIRKLTPLKYLHSPKALLETLMVWQDGMAGVAWWAGLTIHVGMGSTGDGPDSVRLRALYGNRTETLRRAVENYHRFVFVGLLDQRDESLRLLQHTFGWTSSPHMGDANSGNRPHQSHFTDQEQEQLRTALRMLAPMDLWLYAYIAADFRARFDWVAESEIQAWMH